ncbi:hypothetical protein F5I97DRAFT_1455536 [Phlebopus sp. FC_14]|nr:hypothetical protein F5I97DRAFT_1455536 [Phlebopus sp. FC_14]
MFATLFHAALFATLFHRVFADFTIDTPTFVQCQSSQITWTQANPPYDLLVVPANDVCGEAIRDLGNQSSLSLTWLVNLASGTQVVLFLEDAFGDEAWSGTVTVGASNDTSCLSSSTGSVTPSAPSTVPGLPSSTPSSGASPSASAFAPAGAANAGLDPSSGAHTVRPLNIISALGSAVVAVFAFTV